MNEDKHSKVTSSHLKRGAYLYVRQSTLRQVFENSESTKRQYALRERAVSMGWPIERVVVIDCDLGQSGASATGRTGFQRLVGDVGMGLVGIVLGLEVSRLARSSTDWHRLLEICALTDTLILDEDGIYDPSHFNDRLLLGLKGTMSEAELHVLRARLRGGIMSKAKRGELKQPLPVGFLYSPDGRVVLNPDKQVQQSVALLFETFLRTGSACGVVKEFREQGLQFPRRVQTGPRNGEIVWGTLMHSRVLQVLKNPRYAGAFFFGRMTARRTGTGKYIIRMLPREDWHTLIRDAHPGYISWEEHERNIQRLKENGPAYGEERRKTPAREGPALLQGLVTCGVCGNRMTVRYHSRNGRQIPDYSCLKEAIQVGDRMCQRVPGHTLDTAIATLLLDSVTPLALEVALTVQTELAARADEVDRLRRQKVERARYEADLAQRRYMRVDPDNRMVVDTLEADWNSRLRDVAQAQDEYQKSREADSFSVSEQQRAEILALATDFPRLWKDPAVPDKERKRIARLMLDDVTVIKGARITVHARFRGGATRTLELSLPPNAADLRRTSPRVVREVDRLLNQHIEAEIAGLLNEGGFETGTGDTFTAASVRRIREAYDLTDRYTRLRSAGMLTLDEIATRLGVARCTIHMWRRRGLLRVHAYSDRGDYLFEAPNYPIPGKFAHKKPKQQQAERQVPLHTS